MTQITDLQPTSTLGTEDQVAIRQGTIDKRISLELAGILSWAKRNGYTHLGTHITGLVFPDTVSFSTYQGKVYFVRGSTSLPYTATSNTPATETGLFKYEEPTGNGENLLSNHNFLTPSTLVVNSTPQDVSAGVEIFSGVFAGTSGIQGLTYIDGRVSFSGGDFYIPVTNTGALERLTEFVASVADFDGKPRTRGVSFALVGDEYRVTVGIDALEDATTNPTPLGSVKFEQGSVATRHEVQSAKGETYQYETMSQAVSSPPTVGSALTISYYAYNILKTSPIGGGSYVYTAGVDKSLHNGGTIISPTVPFDGALGSIPAFLEGTGETDPTGFGCFVRQLIGYETPEMYGAQHDGVTDDIFSVSKCDATCPSRHIKYTSGIYAIGAHPDHPQGFSPSRDRTTHEGVGFSWTSETGLTVFKYIGPVNDIFAVLKLSTGDIGTDVTLQRNYTVKNLKLDANALAGFCLYENYANNDSSAENIVAVNSRYRAVHVVKSWYNNMKDIVAYNNYGSGISFGIALDDLIPTTTENLNVNGINIPNPRAHSNGRQLPDESVAEWEARRFNEGLGRIANWGIGIGFVHGYEQSNPVSEKNYGPGIYRTNAQGADTRGIISNSGYVERNCNDAIADGVATDFWEVWYDSDNSSTRGEDFKGLWFNPSLDSSRGKVKIVGTPSGTNRNELVRFTKCPNITIPSPSHDQFGNDSDSGGSNMPNPYNYAYQCMGVSSTAFTLRDARDGTSLDYGLFRYDNSPSSDNDKAIELLPRGGITDVAMRVSRNATTGGEDGRSDIGSASIRYDNGFFVNTPTGTSDENLKTDKNPVPAEWIPVLLDIVDSVQLWKWISAVSGKGDSARIHAGPYAQEIYRKFESIGVDAFDYGFVGKDKKFNLISDGIEVAEDGTESPKYKKVSTGEFIWNVRASEIQWLCLWAIRQRQKQIEIKLGL